MSVTKFASASAAVKKAGPLAAMGRLFGRGKKRKSQGDGSMLYRFA